MRCTQHSGGSSSQPVPPERSLVHAGPARLPCAGRPDDLRRPPTRTRQRPNSIDQERTMNHSVFELRWATISLLAFLAVTAGMGVVWAGPGGEVTLTVCRA